MPKTYTLDQFIEWGRAGGKRKASRYTRKQISAMAKQAARKAKRKRTGK